MACDNDACGSVRILTLQGKTSDGCFAQYREKEHDGYVPSLDCIGGGDYINIDICMDCGKVLGNFPVPDEVVMRAMEDVR